MILCEFLSCSQKSPDPVEHAHMHLLGQQRLVPGCGDVGLSLVSEFHLDTSDMFKPDLDSVCDNGRHDEPQQSQLDVTLQ